MIHKKADWIVYKSNIDFFFFQISLSSLGCYKIKAYWVGVIKSNDHITSLKRFGSLSLGSYVLLLMHTSKDDFL